MKHHPIFLIKLLFVASFSLLSLTATAQKNKSFKKPITSPRDRIESSDAKWNVGIVGGGNLTTWLHFHNAAASHWYLKNYNPFDTITHSVGYFGGVAVEYMLRRDFSVGFNVVYAQHNLQLGFVNDHFPYQWTEQTGVEYGKIVKTFKANYRAIEAYLPLTYYIGLASKKNIIPYVYAAPRVSYVIPDSIAQMTYNSAYYKNDGQNTLISSSSNSVEFNQSTYRSLNVGATVGIGSLFRITARNYYFLIKFDVSATMYGLSTFKMGEVVNNEFNYLRYSADAQASLTLMLPLKKQLKGACMNWGEYD